MGTQKKREKGGIIGETEVGAEEYDGQMRINWVNWWGIVRKQIKRGKTVAIVMGLKKKLI